VNLAVSHGQSNQKKLENDAGCGMLLKKSGKRESTDPLRGLMRDETLTRRSPDAARREAGQQRAGSGDRRSTVNHTDSNPFKNK
jgi:hypothetical protein